MDEPLIEKWPHPLGVEYVLSLGDKILGSVVPMDKYEPNKLRRWKALVGQRTVGIFSSKDGRFAAMRVVRHFSKFGDGPCT
jgi:hypothetical protein